MLRLACLGLFLIVSGERVVPKFRNQGQEPPMLDEDKTFGDLEGFLNRHAPPNGSSWDALDKRNHIQVLENVCLKNANNPTGQASKGGRPEWHQMPPSGAMAAGSVLLKGSTYWVNDYMAIGHVQYDSQLLSVLTAPNTQVDQVVLQRAPCETDDLCNKNGGTSVYESFFQSYYGTLLDLEDKSHTNVYIRFTAKESKWTPRPVRYDQWSQSIDESYLQARLPDIPGIAVRNVVCFQKVIRRTTNKGMFYSVSLPMVRKFKKVALERANKEKEVLSSRGKAEWDIDTRDKGNILRVTVIKRGAAQTRHMDNEDQLVQLLSHTLSNITRAGDNHLKLDVRLFDSGRAFLSHAEQVQISATSDILIATHGAFETNVMYMPEGSLLIEIRGLGRHFEVEGKNFHGLAHTYLVHYRSVNATRLLHIKQKRYELGIKEMQEVAQIALDFVQYQFKL